VAPHDARRTLGVTREPVAVLGLGGIGGMVAARTGALCVGTERSVEIIRDRGLTLRDGEQITVFRPEAVERLEQPVSLLVVAVKAYVLEGALGRIAPDVLDRAVVLPLLNGLEHVERIRKHFDARDTTVAAGNIGRVEAYSPEPGVVVQRPVGAALITAASRDLEREPFEAALAPLRVAGLDVVVVDDERAVLWEKAARLAVLSAATIASGEPVGRLRSDGTWRVRLRTALEEACSVAAADGAPLDPAGQWAIIESLPHDLTTSTARDAAAGRPTELDAIAGSVVRAGRRLGIPMPVLESLVADAQARTGRAA
jgi:2-dehydropantoate 2-reductase